MIPIENNKKYFIKDTEITQSKYDKFKHVDISKNIISIIENNPTPFNIAVVGKWGLGKSSLINMVKEHLSKNKTDFIVEDINAWKYEKEALKRVLLRKTLSNLGYKDKSILDNFLDKLHSYSGTIEGTPKTFWQKFKTEWLPILGNALMIYVISILLTIIGHTNYTNFDFKAWISFVLSGFSNNFYIPLLVVLFQNFINTSSGKYNFKVTPPITTTDEYEFQLEKLIKKEKFKNKKIIIIVDDLDRLTPNKIVEALDAIKAFVGYENFVFIVPFDDTILKDAIQKEKTTFNYNEHLTIESDLFLDKLFQHRIHLPSIIQSNMSEYAIEMTKNDAKDLVELCEAEQFELICKEILIHKKVTTPRQAKKIINTFSNNLLLGHRREYNRLDQGVFTSNNAKRFLAKISVLQSDFPMFYSNLFVEHGLMDMFLELSEKIDIEEISIELLKPYFEKNNEDKYRLNKIGESLSMFLHRTASIGVENITKYLYMDEDRLSELFGNEFSLTVRDGLTSGAYTLVREKIEDNLTKDIPNLLYEVLSNSDPVEVEFCCIGIVNLTEIESVFNDKKLLNYVNDRLEGLFISQPSINAIHFNMIQAIKIYEKYNQFNGIDKLILNQFEKQESLIESLIVFFENENILSDTIKVYVKDLINKRCSTEFEQLNFDKLFNIHSLDIGKFFEPYLSDIKFFQRLFSELVLEENYDVDTTKVSAFVKLFKKHIENKNADILLRIISDSINNIELAELLVEDILEYASRFKNADTISLMCMNLISCSNSTIENIVNKILAIFCWKILPAHSKNVDDYIFRNIQDKNISKILNNIVMNSQVDLIPKSVEAVNKIIFEDIVDVITIYKLQKEYNHSQMTALITAIKPAYNYNSNVSSLERATRILELLSSDSKNKTDISVISVIAEHIYSQNSSYPTGMVEQIRAMGVFREGIEETTLQKFIEWSNLKMESYKTTSFTILDVFKNDILESQYSILGDKIMSNANADTLEVAVVLLRVMRKTFASDTSQNTNYKNFLVDNLNNEHTRKSIMQDIMTHYSFIGEFQDFVNEIVKYDDIISESVEAIDKFIDKTNIQNIVETLKDTLIATNNSYIDNVKSIFSILMDDQYVIVLQNLISCVDDSSSIAYLYNLAKITFEIEAIAVTDKVNVMCIMLENCDSASILDVVGIGKNIGKVSKTEDKQKLGESCYNIFRCASSEKEKLEVFSLVKSAMVKSSFTNIGKDKREFSDDEQLLIKK